MPPTLPPVSRPRTRADRASQSLLLGPGVALVGVALVSLLRRTTVIGWTLLALGLVLMLAYIRSTLRARRVRLSPVVPR